jgi:hypothetical protein
MDMCNPARIVKAARAWRSVGAGSGGGGREDPAATVVHEAKGWRTKKEIRGEDVENLNQFAIYTVKNGKIIRE